MLVNMSFFELDPQLECYNPVNLNWTACAKSVACANEQTWRIDYNSHKTIQNWKTELNLVCEEGGKIGMIGSCYFLGFVISLLFIVRLSDIYGRKPLTYLALGT